jgi:hypothetical protein
MLLALLGSALQRCSAAPVAARLRFAMAVATPIGDDTVRPLLACLLACLLECFAWHNAATGSSRELNWTALHYHSAAAVTHCSGVWQIASLGLAGTVVQLSGAGPCCATVHCAYALTGNASMRIL